MSFSPGKIKEFYITTSLNDQAYLSGSLVEGKVIIDLKKPKATNGPLKIVLSGQAKVQWGTDSSRRSDVQTIFDDMTVYLWGTGDETLAAGKHEFPYSFQLPNNIPSSHEDFNGHIRYTLTAVLPARKYEITRQKKISVHGIVIVDTPELINRLDDSSEKTLCCLCCTTAPAVLSVMIDKGGYACGEKIFIQESHGYRRITNVSAVLKRKTTYHIRETGESNFSYRNIASTVLFINSASIPGMKIANLEIPLTVPSINYDVLKVSYVLIVTLAFKLPRVKSLTVSIPITIGNARRLRSGGMPSSIPSAPPLQNTLAAMQSAPAHLMSNTLMCTYMWPNTNDLGVPMSTTTMPSAPPHPALNTLPCTYIRPNTNELEVLISTTTMPSAPPHSASNTLSRAMPSAPLHPRPNILPITSSTQPVPEAETDLQVPDSPPPPYSEF